ncbi:MAG: HlyC/CorC family transporter [Anaerolineae bacterium]|nr:HlyC/CorC family transporter [Anaerolineae bacterium]
MDASNLTSWFLLLMLVLLQALLTVLYYSISNTHKADLKDYAEEGSRRAQRTLQLAENATALLTTQQYVSLLLTTLSTAVLVRFILPGIETDLRQSGLTSEVARLVTMLVVLPLFTLILLVVGTQIPSAAMPAHTERVAMFLTPPARVIVHGLAPVLQLTQRFSQQVGRILGGAGIGTVITEEEIKTLVDAGSEGGLIEDEEKEMIYSVFKFGDTLAREVMVPRIDIEALELSASLEEALDKVVRVGHSRIPVYENSIDNIRGLIYAKDLLMVWRNQEHASKKLEDLLRPPFFIPESKRAVDLLTELQKREVHLAIVIDEYGGTAGLVTIEDLLEEIVGEIRDEYDMLEEAPYEQISENEYICLASLDLDDLNELLDIELPTDENDTLGGFIFTELGAVPKEGDKVVAEGVEMEVLTLDGRRIHRVRVRKVSPRTVADDVTLTEAEETDE